MKTHKLSKDLELFLAGIGAAQSLYLSLYGMFEKRGNFKTWLISLFFLSITLRIVKSILWVYLDETSLWIINSGFWAHSVSGPLLYLYTYYFIFNKKWKSRSLLHLLPSAIFLLLLAQLTLDNFWYSGGYSVLLFHQMTYALLSLAMIFIGYIKIKSGNGIGHLNKKERIWIAVLVLGTVFLQFSYFSNYILGLTPYLLGPVVYTVFIYFLSFFSLKNSRLLFDKKEYKKYSNIHLSDSEIKHIAGQIKMIMENEKPFKDTGYQLRDLSYTLKMPKYLVSHVINSVFSQNFSDYINTYRIKEAKKLLISPEYRAIKIANVAFDCGFNSLSSFNQSFKRHTGTTPSDYKRSSKDL